MLGNMEIRFFVGYEMVMFTPEYPELSEAVPRGVYPLKRFSGKTEAKAFSLRTP